MAEAFKYRAFLSYSHADTGVATRVHARLEGFHIDKELVGRVTPTGPIPKALRPIFRDRNDFDAGSSLGAETGTALDDLGGLDPARFAPCGAQQICQRGGTAVQIAPSRPAVDPADRRWRAGRYGERVLSTGVALRCRAGRRRHRYARRRAGGRSAREGRWVRPGDRKGGRSADRACAQTTSTAVPSASGGGKTGCAWRSPR